MNDIFKQQHSLASDNVKQIFSSFVTWYTFFWTLNMAALGFFYSPQAASLASSQSIHIRLIVTAVFVALNILGIGVCYFCWKSICQLRNEATIAMQNWLNLQENNLATQPAVGLFPVSLSNYVFSAGALSLALNLVAWLLLPIIF